MKFLLSSTILSLFASQAAFARYIGPRLVKETRSGFTLPEFTRNESCEIFADRVVITIQQGAKNEVRTVETKTISVEGDTFGLVRAVSKSPTLTSSGPVDGPSTFYTGFDLQPNDSVKRVVIHSENGGTGQIVESDSSEARVLRSVMDNLCR